MSKFLLIDYGASRIKSALYNDVNQLPAGLFESVGSFLKFGNSTKIESSFFSDSLILHLDYYSNKIKELNVDDNLKIYICSEMHGFSLIPNNSTIENFYYSWRFHHVNTNSALEVLDKNNFLKNTSMTLRAGLPVVNVLAEYLSNTLNENCSFLTLPQLICNDLGEQYNHVCKTLLHSSGFYSNLGETENSSLITGYDLSITFPKVLDDYSQPIGLVNYQNNEYNMYFGFGDLQAAFIGSDINDNQILINIGTGSQIISNSSNQSSFGLEERPFFNNQKLKCVTHIPAGRFLDSWCKFYNNLNKTNNFWTELSILNLNDFKNELIHIDFDSFLETKSSSFIKIDRLISENSGITNKNILASLVKSFADQYLGYLRNAVHEDVEIVLGGGVPSSIPVLEDLISEGLTREVKILKNNNDLTLEGLRAFLIKGF